MPKPIQTKRRQLLKSILKKISLGKYTSEFGDSGADSSHSSVIGGLLSLVIIVVMLFYLGVIAGRILRREHYNLDQSQSFLIGRLFDHDNW